MTTSNPVAEAPKGELVLERTFNAPRDLVFKAWTDPIHLAQWWGPSCFTNPVCEVDARVGGALYIVMRSPWGTDHPMKGVFQEVVVPELLTFTNIAVDENGNTLLEGLTKVFFEDVGGNTKVTVDTRMVGKAEIAAKMLEGMEAGWSQSLEKLEKSLAEGFQATSGEGTAATGTSTSDVSAREIATTRIFDAPRDLVWEAWTKPEHLVNWWGPNGFTTTMQEMDVRPGGAWNFIMHGPDGTDYQNASTFVEVVKPELLSYEHKSPGFLATVTFEEDGGKTKLHMSMVFESAEVRELVATKFGAVEGQQQTLRRLNDYLAGM